MQVQVELETTFLVNLFFQDLFVWPIFCQICLSSKTRMYWYAWFPLRRKKLQKFVIKNLTNDAQESLFKWTYIAANKYTVLRTEQKPYFKFVSGIFSSYHNLAVV